MDILTFNQKDIVEPHNLSQFFANFKLPTCFTKRKNWGWLQLEKGRFFWLFSLKEQGSGGAIAD